MIRKKTAEEGRVGEEEVLGGFDTGDIWRSAGSRASCWTVRVREGRTELRKERVKVLRYLDRETLEKHAWGDAQTPPGLQRCYADAE